MLCFSIVCYVTNYVILLNFFSKCITLLFILNNVNFQKNHKIECLLILVKLHYLSSFQIIHFKKYILYKNISLFENLFFYRLGIFFIKIKKILFYERTKMSCCPRQQELPQHNLSKELRNNHEGQLNQSNLGFALQRSRIRVLSGHWRLTQSLT